MKWRTTLDNVKFTLDQRILNAHWLGTRKIRIQSIGVSKQPPRGHQAL
jgi:hypothetical protein